MNAGPRRLLAALTAVLAAAVLAPSAAANTEDIIAPSSPPYTPSSGWQAGTCTADAPVCSVATPGQFFENAAGHPQVGFTQFIVRNHPGSLGPILSPEEPIGELKTVHVDLPVGLSVNPQATPQCPTATGESNPGSCPANTKVGQSQITGSVLGVVSPTTIDADVYNIEPPAGEPALFGFSIAGAANVFLRAEVSWDGDYHEGFTIAVPPLPISGILPGGLILKNRLVFDGRSGDGTFITTPSTCFDPETDAGKEQVYSTWLQASSIEEEEDPGYQFPASAEPRLESPLPPGKKPIDCANIPYEPSADVDPGNSRQPTRLRGPPPKSRCPTSSAAAKARARTPERRGSPCRPGSVSTPRRAPGSSPAPTRSSARARRLRSPARRARRSARSRSRPRRCANPTGPSKETSSSAPSSAATPPPGDEYRIFVDAESARYGISVRLLGRVSADPVSGQLTTRFEGLPQVPFSSFVLKLDGGPRATLTSPATCGPHRMVATMTPWSGNPAATPSSEFTLTSAPGGGACPPTLGERPFAPGFEARASDTRAGGFTDLGIDVARSEGDQELKGVEVTLPPGMTAKLAGLRYCPEEAIAAAAANGGLAEAAAPAVPATASSAARRSQPEAAPSPFTSTPARPSSQAPTTGRRCPWR